VVQGEWAKALSKLERVSEVARTGSVHYMRAAAVPVTAYIRARVGESKEALHRVREGEELLPRVIASGMLFNLGSAFRDLSLACLLHDEMGMPFWLEQTEEVMRRLDT